MLGYSCKRAAAEGGYSSSSSLAVSLRPIIDVCPSSLSRSISVEHLLDRYMAELTTIDIAPTDRGI